MILEARSAGCFSWTYVLKANDRPIGRFEGQWLSESVTIDLTERRHLEFRKISWLGSQFQLVDLEDEGLLGECDRAGLLTSAWDVTLSVGAGQLIKPGWFDTSYEFVQAEETLARVDRLGWCERGFTVDGADILTEEDLVMIGLVYHTIQNRQRRQHNNSGGAAAGS